MRGLAQKGLLYGTVLIGMYLVGGKASGWGRLMKDAASAGRSTVRTFQGK